MIPSSPVTSPGTLFAVGASGTIVEIGEVDPNDRYAFGPFKCIECGSEMVPHKGKVRAHHFKHFGPRTPACTDETYLHFLAKTQLYETIRDAMAAGRPYNIEFKRPYVCNRNKMEFGHVCRQHSGIEKWDVTRAFDKVALETRHADFIPDVLLSSSRHDDVLFLEIKVSHGCEEEKIKSGFRIIEVEVSDKADISRLKKGISLNKGSTKTYGLRDIEPKDVLCKKACSATGTAFVAYASGKTIVKTATFEELRRMKSWSATKLFKFLGSDGHIAPWDYVDIYFENSVEARFEKDIKVLSCLLCRKGGLGKYEKEIFCFEQGIETDINAAHDCKYYVPVDDEAEARRRFERSRRYLERSRMDWSSNPADFEWRPDWWRTNEETDVVED